MKKHLDKLPIVLCFLIAIAFSIKSLREPDLWWQIRTGEWIIEHHQIPKQDVFSYSFEGKPWINVKWGFEVLAAFITKISGPECVFILQALVACLIVFSLVKIASRFRISRIAIPLLLTLVAMEYRIIGRPEMFSHFFTVVFLFFLLRNRKEPSNKIFWLLALQILWANFHEAFGIGMVLTTIFFVGGWLEYFLSKRNFFSKKTELPKNISILLVAQIASVTINPNGIKLLLQPLNILGQVYENKFTTELLDFRSPEYWQWNVYWVMGLLVTGALGTLVHYRTLKTKANRFKLFIEQFGIGYLLTLVAFFYLAATAYRNIVFLALVFFPLLSFGFDALWGKISLFQKFQKQVFIGLCVLLGGIYTLIVSNKYYEWTNSHDRFGMEVLSTYNPHGAAEFIAQNHLHGKCFSDYLTSSYLLWKLQPGFKTFIDLRDLDVFPSEFFSTFAAAVTFPDEFERLDSTYHFNYVVLYRPQFTALHNHLFRVGNFKLIFLDPVAAVYTRKISPSDTSSVLFTNTKSIPTSFFVFAINKILNPLYSAYNYGKVDYDLPAAGYFVSVGKLDEAEKFALKSSTNNIENYKGKEMLGEVYYTRATHASDMATKNKWLNAAGNIYLQTLNEKSDYGQAYLGLGAVYFQEKDYKQAIENFELAILHDRNNLNAYLFAAECGKYFVNLNNAESKDYLQHTIELYLKANKLNPDNPTITFNLGFLYFRLNDCKNSSKYLMKISDFQGISEDQRKQAKDCLRKCDP